MDLRDSSEHGYGIDLSSLPATAGEAESAGSPYFFTGKPCSHGHVSPRYTKGGSCAYCIRARNARVRGVDYNHNPGRIARYKARVASIDAGKSTYIPAAPCKHGHMLRFIASNNCVECDAGLRKRRAVTAKFSRIKKEYGIDRDSYMRLVASQKSSCAICSKHEQNHFSLHVDHCHKTGTVRALLCQQCNQAIGLFNEDVLRMQSAISYLVRHGA